MTTSIDPHYFMRGGGFYYNTHLFVLRRIAPLSF